MKKITVCLFEHGRHAVRACDLAFYDMNATKPKFRTRLTLKWTWVERVQRTVQLSGARREVVTAEYTLVLSQ